VGGDTCFLPGGWIPFARRGWPPTSLTNLSLTKIVSAYRDDTCRVQVSLGGFESKKPLVAKIAGLLQNWRRNEEGGGALVLRRRPFGVSADAVRTNQLFLHPRPATASSSRHTYPGVVGVGLARRPAFFVFPRRQPSSPLNWLLLLPAYWFRTLPSSALRAQGDIRHRST